MNRKATVVPHVLIAIFAGFICIMVYVYIEARNLDPVLLDEHGNIRGAKR